ncbi:hypothetical protein Y032_0219g2445 [Ancylostoma ceylanicum]|nr:hypothetical protein Y032_0219g2445 [Ancylostoma ceylanicum]
MLARGVGGGVPLECNGRREWIGVSWNGTEKVTVYDVKCEIYIPPPTTTTAAPTPAPIRFLRGKVWSDYEPEPLLESGNEMEESEEGEHSEAELEESREGAQSVEESGEGAHSEAELEESVEKEHSKEED